MKIGNLSLLNSIGKGTMGEVFLSTKKDSKEYYATKKIDRKNADRPEVKRYFTNEIKLLRSLKHNKIIRLVDLKQTPSHYYIVMEYCNGGSLLSCLNKNKKLYKKPFSEEIVQYLMRQIVSGLKYIHRHKIVHRDIKLDNILVKFYSEDDLKKLNMMKTHIKISDFGISIHLDDSKLAYTALGSPAYMDPFILKKLNERNDILNSEGYDQSADIWSLGAICYEMLIGKRVFTGRNIKDLYKKVEEGNYIVPTYLSKEVVSFINGMLQYDSQKRLTCEELSRHRFLTRNLKEFSPIDFELVKNKLGADGINFNTKNNTTMWNIFNEETEVKLNSIPIRILDDKAIPESQNNENEIEIPDNQNQIQNQNLNKYQQVISQSQKNNVYDPYNSNNINQQFYTQIQFNNNNFDQFNQINNNINSINKVREDKSNKGNYNNNFYQINEDNSNNVNYNNNNFYQINEDKSNNANYNNNNFYQINEDKSNKINYKNYDNISKNKVDKSNNNYNDNLYQIKEDKSNKVTYNNKTNEIKKDKSNNDNYNNKTQKIKQDKSNKANYNNNTYHTKGDKSNKINYNNNNSNNNINNFANSNIQFSTQNFNEYNTYQNFQNNYNYNNLVSGTNADNFGNTASPYQASNQQNINVPFYEGYTVNPEMNKDMKKQMDPNYPGDIKVKKQIATTDESCLHQ